MRWMLILALLPMACRNPARDTPPSEPLRVADDGPVRASVPSDPLCAALLPRVEAIYESDHDRSEALSRLVSQGHVDPCDHAAPHDDSPAAGTEEAAYCRAAISHELCGRSQEVTRVTEGRVRAFPDSPDAWLARARWQFAPLRPADGSGLPYNESLAPSERIRIADEVLATLRRVEQLRPHDSRIYALMAATYDQRQNARLVVERPSTPAEELEVVRARDDGELAWRARQKACAIEQRSPCSRTDPKPEAGRSAPDEQEEVQEVPLEEIDVEASSVPAERSRIDSSKLPAVADADAVQISAAKAKAGAIYSPAPDSELLAATRAAEVKRPVEAAVRYCVDARGRTLGIESRPPGDPEIDRILRDTIAQWRFRPFMSGGKLQTVCTTERFDLRFD